MLINKLFRRFPSAGSASSHQLSPGQYAQICKRSSSSNVLTSDHDIELTHQPLQHLMWSNFSQHSHRTAIECSVSGKKYSYGKLLDKCKRFSSSLNKMGIKRRESIGIYVPNIPEYPIVFLGSLELDLIVNTISPSYTPAELSYQLRNSDIKWIVCHPTNISTVREAGRMLKRDIKIICTHNIDGSSPQIAEKTVLLEDMIDDLVKISEISSHDIDTSETSVVFYSSGTTGLPKGVCLTHKSVTASQQQWVSDPVRTFIEAHGEHQDVVPATMPFFHIYGNSGSLLASLRHGAKIITIPKYFPESYIKLLADKRNILLFVAPPILLFLGNSITVTSSHLENVREIMTGGAPVNQMDLERVFNKFKGSISNGFGMTEMSGIVSLDKVNPTTFQQNNGKLVAGTSCKVVNPVTGDILPANSSGEICFKGPQMMKCYLNNAKATAETIDEDGWLHSGDVGYYDNRGLIQYTDRKKDLIKVSGFQVAPAELEEVLRRFPGVEEAGVVGAPDRRTGEVPVAFVQTSPGVRVSEQEIKLFLASQLSRYKHLSSVRFLQTIPKTPSGKILRKQLKQLL